VAGALFTQPAGGVPLPLRLWLTDPAALSTHRCLRLTAEDDIETPYFFEPPQGRRSCQTPVAVGRLVTRITHDHGISVRQAGLGRANQLLQEFVEEGITVAGLPVIVSDQLDANTRFWGVRSGACHPGRPQGYQGRAVPERPEGWHLF
jgi:hypothetical protein